MIVFIPYILTHAPRKGHAAQKYSMSFQPSGRVIRLTCGRIKRRLPDEEEDSLGFRTVAADAERAGAERVGALRLPDAVNAVAPYRLRAACGDVHRARARDLKDRLAAEHRALACRRYLRLQVTRTGRAMLPLSDIAGEKRIRHDVSSLDDIDDTAAQKAANRRMQR